VATFVEAIMMRIEKAVAIILVVSILVVGYIQGQDVEQCKINHSEGFCLQTFAR